jgi:hypothetical protein
MLLAALLALTTPQQQCAAMDANLPAPLASWATPGPGDPMDLSRPVTLVPMERSRVPGLPATAKAGNATGIPFTVTVAGTYGVAVDQAAWIDVAPTGGAPLTSVKHGHGPECSTIRKIVRFELKPGEYWIFLSGLGDANVRVMLVAPE